MLLKEYVSEVFDAIAEYSRTGLILSSNLATDIRTEKIGVVKGEIAFIDGSALFFREYLDLRYRLDKKMYAYHYQDFQAILRFRYDDANHRPALGFRDHKHTAEMTLPSVVPSLQDVLNEIVNDYFTG